MTKEKFLKMKNTLHVYCKMETILIDLEFKTEQF